MKKRRKIIISLIILFIFLIIICLLHSQQHNFTTNTINESSIKSIYLYHGNDVGAIEPDSVLFHDFINEILDAVNNKNLCSDTIDGLIILRGNGVPMDKNDSGYSIEINFTQPETLSFLGKKQTDICTLFLTLDNNCLYIYKGNRSEEMTAFSGYRCTKKSLKKIKSMTKEYFNSNN